MAHMLIMNPTNPVTVVDPVQRAARVVRKADIGGGAVDEEHVLQRGRCVE